MDHDPAVVDAEPAPKSSVEKVVELLDELASTGANGALGMAAAMLPLARAALPTDSTELDQLLLTGAKMCFELRSDGAWEPATMDDLWLGRGEETDPELEGQT